jgi:predicted negative regulator of RcsB-dependent stress response
MKKFWQKKNEEEVPQDSSPVEEEKKPIEAKLTDDDKEKLKQMIAQAEKEKYERFGRLLGSRRGKK